MRIRLELSDSEEIVIRCREETDHTERLMRAIEELLTRKDTVVLSSGGAEHFVPKNEITETQVNTIEKLYNKGMTDPNDIKDIVDGISGYASGFVLEKDNILLTRSYFCSCNNIATSTR